MQHGFYILSLRSVLNALDFHDKKIFLFCGFTDLPLFL